MEWIKFSDVDELPKNEILLVANETSIDYIIYCYNSWCFCYTEQPISENLLGTSKKYLIPKL